MVFFSIFTDCRGEFKVLLEFLFIHKPFWSKIVFKNCKIRLRSKNSGVAIGGGVGVLHPLPPPLFSKLSDFKYVLSDNFFELMSVGSDDLIQQKSFSSYCINFWPFTIRRIIFRSLFTTFTRMIHLSDDIHFFHCFILFGNRQICYQTLRSLPTDISAPSFCVIGIRLLVKNASAFER